MTSFLLFSIKKTFISIFFSFFSISLTSLPEPHIWIWTNLNSSFNHILHFFTPKFPIQPPPRKPRLILQSVSFIFTSLNIVRAKSQNSTDWCHYKFLDFNLHHILRIILSFTLMRFSPSNISLNNCVKASIFSQILPAWHSAIIPTLSKGGVEGGYSGISTLIFHLLTHKG